jgi:hypothetical protein
MTDTTWDSRYNKIVNNDNRNFNFWGENSSYTPCNIFCNFNITKLDEKNYIKGITATSSSNLLHINPLVNTEPPQKGLQAVGVHTGETEERKEKVYIYYGYNDGVMRKYELIDIFIQSPSKSVLAGKRYKMEVCLLFSTEVQDQFVIICVPMDISPINKTDDVLQKDRFSILMAIANNFPSKGKTYSIENSPNWDPRVFLPVKNENNSSFFTWGDEKTKKIIYIQFEHPISAPYKFFETFATTLSGGVSTLEESTKLPAKKEYAGLEILYNKNIPNTDIKTIKTCVEKPNNNIQALINFSKDFDKKEDIKNKNKNKKCDNKKECKQDKWLYIVVCILSIIIFLVLLFYFRVRIKNFFSFFFNKSSKNTTIESTNSSNISGQKA